MKAVIDCFKQMEPQLEDESVHRTSDDVLALVRPHLANIGFAVETGKGNKETLFGVATETETEPGRGFKYKYVIYGLLLFLCMMIGWYVFFRQKTTNSDTPSYEKKETTIGGEAKQVPLEAEKPSQTIRDSEPTDVDAAPLATGDSPSMEAVSVAPNEVAPNDEANQAAAESESSTLEMLERINHRDAVRRAQRAGVSTEGSTSEILERTNHADVVKRAQRAGVSTEGSTTEILERINHAGVVKRARRAGVSTEGSTIEILERINHADVVKRARRAGVSTAGSTTDILERINHADMVKQAKRMGVSTEGSTIEISERINRKKMEKYNY